MVRSLRNMFGLSQSDLSTLAKVARPTLSKLEKLDTEGVRADTLEKTMAFFKYQGVDFAFDKHGVTLHIPNEALIKAGILVKENTKSRGSSALEQEQAADDMTPLARQENETITDYVARLNEIIR